MALVSGHKAHLSGLAEGPFFVLAVVPFSAPGEGQFAVLAGDPVAVLAGGPFAGPAEVLSWDFAEELVSGLVAVAAFAAVH